VEESQYTLEARAALPDLLGDIDTTNINHENMPNVMTSMVNQMRVLCICFREMQAAQKEDHDSLLIFRVSKCGLKWIKEPNNIKALTQLIIVIWIICVIFMGSADQVSRMFSHYVFHYP
jgi:hypothetical protein